MTGDEAPTLEPLPVVSATITAGSVRVEHMQSTIAALSTKSIAGHIVVGCGPYLDMGRNRAARQWYADELDVDPDFLLFVDSDISYKPADIRRLVADTIDYRNTYGVWPLTGGVYRGSVGSQIVTVAYDWVDVTLPDGTVERQLHNVDEHRVIAADCLMECGAFGTGFMLIHRSILDACRETFDHPQEFFWEGVLNGTWFGEDLVFCMRAQALGHPILIHAGVRLTHHKEIGIEYPAPAPAPGET